MQLIKMSMSMVGLNTNVMLGSSTVQMFVPRSLRLLACAYDHTQLRGMYTILSGDPSRGSIALEGENAPSEGAIVRVRRIHII